MNKLRFFSGDIFSLIALALLSASLVVFWLMPHLTCAGCTSVFWGASGEVQSLAPFGKWEHPSFVVDGFSGEFPVWYNYYSYYIMSFLARIFNVSTVYAGSVIFGPFAIFLLPFINYFSLRYAGNSPVSALVASVIISALADAAFLDWLYPIIDSQGSIGFVKTIFHVPAVSIGYGTAQTLGWILFIPTLAIFSVAVNRGKPLLFLFSGALFGILLVSHTLTLLNVATAASLYIFLHNNFVRDLPNQIFSRQRLIIFSAGIIGLGVSGKLLGFGNLHFVGLWGVLWIFAIRNKKDAIILLIFAAGGILTSYQYLWQLWSLRDGLQSIKITAFTQADVDTIFVVFLPLWLGAAVLFFRNRKYLNNSSIVWPFAILIATLILAQGSYFGFQNHPYRFAIHLIFPLAIMFGLFIGKDKQSWFGLAASIFLGGWVSVSIVKILIATTGLYPSAAVQLGQSRVLNQFSEQKENRVAMYSALEKATSIMDGKLLLAPADSKYKFLPNSGILASYSNIPGFIPDPRYIAWFDLYRERVDVACSVFPDYPYKDIFGKDSGCEFDDGLSIIDQTARADILPIYGISIAADLGSVYSTHLQKSKKIYGWQPIHEDGDMVIYNLVAKPTDNKITFHEATFQAPYWSIPFTSPTDGSFTFVAAGRYANKKIKTIRLDKSNFELKRSGINSLSFKASIQKGSGVLKFKLAPDWRFEHTLPAPLYFLTGRTNDNIKQTVVVK